MIEIPSKLRYTFKTRPFSHQLRALQKIKNLEGICALFMEMGTGKTKVAIDWAGIGFYNHGLRRVVVVAPLSVLSVWTRQIRLHSTAPARIFVLTGPTDNRIRVLQLLLSPAGANDETITWIIINYEGLWRQGSGSSVEECLKHWGADLIIFDESHRLKSASSKQSRSAHRIAQTVSQRLLLTGTPITKAPLDIFGQFRAMNEEVFGSSWGKFKFQYGVWGGPFHQQLRYLRNVKGIVRRIRAWSFRIKKSQCLDLPPKLFSDVPVTLSERAVKLYRQMAKEMIIEIEETHATAAIVLVKLLRLSQITSGFIKDIDGKIRIFDDSKLKTCMDLLDDILEEDHKVVIFVRFITDIERLAEALTNKQIKYRILSGSVPFNQRDSIVQEFQEKPEIKVFIAQIQAGSLGIELTAADIAIYYSVTYNAADYWQSQDRLHRQGQKRAVTYYRLIAPRTIDHTVFQVLETKGKIAEVVLHDPTILTQ